MRFLVKIGGVEIWEIHKDISNVNDQIILMNFNIFLEHHTVLRHPDFKILAGN